MLKPEELKELYKELKNPASWHWKVDVHTSWFEHHTEYLGLSHLHKILSDLEKEETDEAKKQANEIFIFLASLRKIFSIKNQLLSLPTFGVNKSKYVDVIEAIDIVLNDVPEKTYQARKKHLKRDGFPVDDPEYQDLLTLVIKNWEIVIKNYSMSKLCKEFFIKQYKNITRRETLEALFKVVNHYDGSVDQLCTLQKFIFSEEDLIALLKIVKVIWLDKSYVLDKLPRIATKRGVSYGLIEISKAFTNPTTKHYLDLIKEIEDNASKIHTEEDLVFFINWYNSKHASGKYLERYINNYVDMIVEKIGVNHAEAEKILAQMNVVRSIMNQANLEDVIISYTRIFNAFNHERQLAFRSEIDFLVLLKIINEKNYAIFFSQLAENVKVYTSSFDAIYYAYVFCKDIISENNLIKIREIIFEIKDVTNNFTNLFSTLESDRNDIGYKKMLKDSEIDFLIFLRDTLTYTNRDDSSKLFILVIPECKNMISHDFNNLKEVCLIVGNLMNKIPYIAVDKVLMHTMPVCNEVIANDIRKLKEVCLILIEASDKLTLSVGVSHQHYNIVFKFGLPACKKIIGQDIKLLKEVLLTLVEICESINLEFPSHIFETGLDVCSDIFAHDLSKLREVILIFSKIAIKTNPDRFNVLFIASLPACKSIIGNNISRLEEVCEILSNFVNSINSNYFISQSDCRLDIFIGFMGNDPEKLKDVCSIMAQIYNEVKGDSLKSIFNFGLPSCMQLCDGDVNKLKAFVSDLLNIYKNNLEDCLQIYLVLLKNNFTKEETYELTKKISIALKKRIRDLGHKSISFNLNSFVNDIFDNIKMDEIRENQDLFIRLVILIPDYNEEDFAYIYESIKKLRTENLNLRYLSLLHGWIEERHFSPRAFHRDFAVVKFSKNLLDFCIYTLKKEKLFLNPDLAVHLLSHKNVQDIGLVIAECKSKHSEMWKMAKLYSDLRNKIDYKYKKISYDFEWNDFKNKKVATLEQIENDNFETYKRLSLIACLEIIRLESLLKKIRSVSNRQILVIGNLRLGRIYLEPLKKTDAVKNVKYIEAKIGSTIFHEADFDTVNPFDRKTIKYILSKRPHVVIIDASINNRFPDGLKGYLNFFNAVNVVISKHQGESLLSRIIRRKPKALGEDDQISSSYSDSATYRMLEELFTKHIVLGNIEISGSSYEPFFLGHASITRLSLIRTGRAGSKREYVEEINASDIPEHNYNKDMVTDDFIQNNVKGKKCLFLLNAFFPFDKVYNDRATEIIRELTGEIPNGTGISFDDVDPALGEKVAVDYEKMIVKLDNEPLLERICDLYLKIRKKFF